MDFIYEDVIKLLLAILFGGLIGIEREFRDKAAGFRTIIFICVGATLFTIFSVRLSTQGDPGRIAANILTGVGFLGAGVLMRSEGRIMGLTTAAIIWLTAAIGMGIGSGKYILSGVATVLTLVIMWAFPMIEALINRYIDVRYYEINFMGDPKKTKHLDTLVNDHKLKILDTRRGKNGDQVVYHMVVTGAPRNHDQLSEALLYDPDIITFKS